MRLPAPKGRAGRATPYCRFSSFLRAVAPGTRWPRRTASRGSVFRGGRLTPRAGGRPDDRLRFATAGPILCCVDPGDGDRPAAGYIDTKTRPAKVRTLQFGKWGTMVLPRPTRCHVKPPNQQPGQECAHLDNSARPCHEPSKEYDSKILRSQPRAIPQNGFSICADYATFDQSFGQQRRDDGTAGFGTDTRGDQKRGDLFLSDPRPTPSAGPAG